MSRERASSGGDVSLQEARRTFTRNHVCEAARELFHEHGYETTTFEQIATAAGTRRTTLYSHFRDKEEILAAISDAYHEGLCLLVEELAGPSPDRAQIDTWIESLVAYVAQEKVPATLVIGMGTGANRPEATVRSSHTFMATLAERIPAFRKAIDSERGLAGAWAKVVIRELSFACLEAARDGQDKDHALHVAGDLFEKFVKDFA